MSSLNVLRSESNSKIKINFDGGDLSSDAGLLLLKEFICKIGLDKLIEQ
ncbi:MAG: transposase, partial [Anaerocolumna sp.]